MEEIRLIIVYLVVWIVIAICFFVAGMMLVKENEHKCDDCKWRFVCNRKICIK